MFVSRLNSRSGILIGASLFASCAVLVTCVVADPCPNHGHVSSLCTGCGAARECEGGTVIQCESGKRIVPVPGPFECGTSEGRQNCRDSEQAAHCCVEYACQFEDDGCFPNVETKQDRPFTAKTSDPCVK